jgi:hypothetical protein
MYKPNFCADCGARIERTRWRMWTSRRFCPSCDKRFGNSRLFVSLVACAALVASGFAAGRLIRPAPPPLIIKRTTDAPALASTSPTATGSPANTHSVETRYGPDGTAAERPTDPEEVVSICGARTQKGTPCSRRVRGTGRCWQHKGKPAMLPPAKLIVQG